MKKNYQKIFFINVKDIYINELLYYEKELSKNILSKFKRHIYIRDKLILLARYQYQPYQPLC